jgi:hypothetical protein
MSQAGIDPMDMLIVVMVLCAVVLALLLWKGIE